MTPETASPGQKRRDLDQRVREAVNRLLRRLPVTVGEVKGPALVFGSTARGDARPESDVDVLLILERDDLATRRHVFDLAFDVFLETDVLISPLVVSPARLAAMRRDGRRLIREIERDGVPVS
jgi:predicted nucleotidyltransferase